MFQLSQDSCSPGIHETPLGRNITILRSSGHFNIVTIAWEMYNKGGGIAQRDFLRYNGSVTFAEGEIEKVTLFNNLANKVILFNECFYVIDQILFSDIEPRSLLFMFFSLFYI